MFAATSHSSVETMWMPPNKNKSAPPEQPDKPPSKSAIRRARHLLAALSFEPPQLRRRRRRRRKAAPSKKSKQKQQQQRAGGPPPTDTASTIGTTNSNIVRGLPVETSDSSCDDDYHHHHHHHGHHHHKNAKQQKHFDVYYDAAQYGDLASDEFSARPQRDAIVLEGITTTTVVSPTQQQERDNEDAYETVYRDGASKNTQQQQEKDENEGEDEEGTECDDFFYYDDSAEFSTSTAASCSQQDYNEEEEEEAVEVSAGKEHDHVHHHVVHSGSSSSRPVLRPPPPPLPPRELPLRFLRAGKNDPVEGVRRYEATLQMRLDQRLDTILREPSPLFPLIKRHYPHYCHLKGKNGEPCFYEQPPRTNLKALRAGGVNLESLLRHYKMITEYQWQWCERDDLQHSIYVIDLEGIRMMDFVGESVEFVKLASAFSAQHYPERAGFVFVVNVPSWFKMIWNVVKPIVDEDTLHKIYILRGRDEIRQAMMERIPLENIPPEYGGNSVPLGESPEERTLAEWIAHNNALAAADGQQPRTCCDDAECQFCNWTPARAY